MSHQIEDFNGMHDEMCPAGGETYEGCVCWPPASNPLLKSRQQHNAETAHWRVRGSHGWMGYRYFSHERDALAYIAGRSLSLERRTAGGWSKTI